MSGIMINWDFSEFWRFLKDTDFGADVKNKEDAERLTLRVIDQYKDSHVTDFLMNIFCQIAVYPSSVMECFMDKYNQKIENGKTVDYTGDNFWFEKYYQWTVEYGIDIFALWTKRLRELGINSWLTFRMNDLHYMESENSPIRPDFSYEHFPAMGRARHRQRRDNFFDDLWDFEQPLIRQKMLEYIDESLAKYDADGIELDFMREMFCFQPGHEYSGIDIMNGFMEKVREITEKHTKLRGHKISVAVRLPESPETALYLGFDVAAWARNELIDTVIPAPRWATSDPLLPVEMWTRLVSPYGVCVAPCLEIITRENPSYPYVFQSAETTAAMAAGFYGAGANKIYLFNYFTVMPGNLNTISKVLPQAAESHCVMKDDNFTKVIQSLGDPQSAYKADRRHIVSFREAVFQPFWEADIFLQVPKTCHEYDVGKFRIRTGPVPEDSDVKVVFGIPTDERLQSEDITVYLNSAKINLLNCDNGEVSTPFTKAQLYVFEADSSAITQINTLEVVAEHQSFTVEHVEIYICPKKEV